MVLNFELIAKAEGERWDEAGEYASASTIVTMNLNSMAYFGMSVEFGESMKGLRVRDKRGLHRR